MEVTINKLATAKVVLPFINCAISAGFPSPAADYQESEIDLSKELQGNSNTTYVVRIKGNSMEGASMPDGCLAIVDRSIKPVSGHIVVAVLDGQFTVKRLVVTNRHVVLHPENSLYKPIIITNQMDFTIWGVVTHTIVKQ